MLKIFKKTKRLMDIKEKQLKLEIEQKKLLEAILQEVQEMRKCYL